MSYTKEYARDVLGADCDHCPLNDIGRFVPSTGPSQATLAFVGEAPGVQEAAQGIPFIGPSGKLLDVVNDNYGIKREEVLLTNACLCRAPSNDVPKMAIASCRTRLHNELSAAGVSSAVALGNSASLGLLGIEGVTKLRVGPGRTSPYDKLADIRIIPTVHPAACLRQSDMFPSLVADVAKVVTPFVPWREPEVNVLDEAEAACEYLNSIRDGEELVLDIEVDIDKDTSYDHPDRYGMLCIGFVREEDEDFATIIGENALKNPFVIEALRLALQRALLTGQNGKFDCGGLYPLVGGLELDFDTMLAHYSLDERTVGIHGLKQMAIEELGAPPYDDELKKYVGGPAYVNEDGEIYYGYGKVPRPILYKYCGYDCVATKRLKRKMVPKLETKQPAWWGQDQYTARYPYQTLRTLHDHLVFCSNQLMYLELNGMKIDRAYNQELWDTMEVSCQEIENELNKVLIDEGYSLINPRSPKQVMGALEFFRVRAPDTREDTLKLLNEQMLEKYKDGAYEKPLYNFVDALLRYRKEHKLFSTYVKGVTKRIYKGRIYTTIKLHGTVSGRTASRNPNAQNWPRRAHIKKQVIPSSPERVFVNADMKQAELRIEAWLADEPFLRDILNDPERDLFNELTPGMYHGLTKDDVGTKVSEEIWKDIRVRVKAFVYGLSYGRKYQSIAHEYRMQEEEAKKMAHGFFEQIPNVVEWQKWVKEQVKAGHDLITPFGRHRRFHLITKENWNNVQNEALAFLPQSTSSDICLRAMARVRRDLSGTGAYVRNFVHDSILVDCEPDMVDHVSHLLDSRLVESAYEVTGDYVRFATDVTVGKHWGEV